MRLTYKLTLLTLVIGLLLSLGIVLIIDTELKKHALTVAEDRAEMFLRDRLSINNYWNQELRPRISQLMNKDELDPDYFDPTWMSVSYANRIIIEDFRENSKFKDFYYKNAAINARSPHNEANEYEQEFYLELVKDPSLEKWSGIREIGGEPFYVQLVRNVNFSDACMRCHSTPEAAPQDMVKLYGAERSFNKQPEQLASVISLRIPLEKAYAEVAEVSRYLSLFLAGLIFTVLSLQLLLIRKTVIAPVQLLRDKATQIAEHSHLVGDSIQVSASKEFADLSAAFTSMSVALDEERRSLEATVEDRTRSLRIANQALSHEIEERKQIEISLRESEERFRLAFETSPDPVLLTRLDSGAIVDVNESFEKIMGISKAAVVGRNSRELNLWVVPAMRDVFRKRMKTDGQVDNLDAEFNIHDGRIMSGLISARLLKLNNEQCVLTVLRDVTSIKAAERALIEMDQMKNEFISMAAHELRTPLSSMMGFTEFLLKPEQFGGFTEEQKKEFLSNVYDKGESLNRRIDDLLDFSHIESGRPITLDLQRCELNALLTSVIDTHRLQNRSENTFRLDLPEADGSAEALIDRHRINQVLDNLLSNAVKYSPVGSQISVTGEAASTGWEIMVTDQGKGMTPDQVEKIFDKFYRADASDTSVEGLGLGMSIVRQIVEAHGGSIRVDSIKDEGTKVTFTIPYSTD